MIDAFGWVIDTYGKEMMCYHADETVAARGRAIVQPMTRGDWQYTAGSLGEFDPDTFLGLTKPDMPLDKLEPGDFLSWDGQDFELMTVRPIWVGGQVTHQWLALRRRAAQPA